ncbi:ComF family protein [Thiospirillum jenense]|uniref:ComF family protein n=2 Tax=Thiospirillum jenense TaxID=1653858 RepID=A0A839HEP4_9GAMM|nr:ComF family protein [Thiospirillum jenense]MBB1125657.1 ComF family protein [Thiospirillum jenense]
MTAAGVHWITTAWRAVYPPTCLLCGAAGAGGLDICTGCRADLPWITAACPRCAQPRAPLSHSPQQLCGQCRRQPPPYQRCLALLHYQEPVRSLIHGLKFDDQMAVLRLFGNLMAEVLPTAPLWRQPDLLIPMPLHPRRLRQRGYNQVLELARILAPPLALTLDSRSCKRDHFTTPQAQLNRIERLDNIRGAFRATRRLDGCRIVVLDDVVTTGATVGELTQVLQAAGAAWVDVWTLARTGTINQSPLTNEVFNHDR